MRTIGTLLATVGVRTAFARDALLAVPVIAVAVTVTVVNVAKHGAPRLSPLPPHFAVAAVVTAVVGAAAAIAWRRRAPVTVLVIAVAASVTEAWLMPSQNAAWPSVWIGLYSCGAYCGRRRAAVCWLLACTASAVSGIVAPNSTRALDTEAIGRAVMLGGVVNDALVFGIIALLGAYVRTQRAYRRELVMRAERLERDRERHLAGAIIDERGRIARELHDVVAHHLSGMVVQAGAAEQLVDCDPVRARALMADIRASGRDTLTSMRRLIAVLRADDDTDGMGPQPRLHQLADIIDNARAAGVPIDATVEGDPRPLPDDVDLAACRILQEALTNVRKHAPGAVANVHVRYGLRDVEICVVDDGPEPDIVSETEELEPSGGVGLVGIGERIAILGGDFSVGPRPQGGWRLCARLPLGDVESRAQHSTHDQVAEAELR